MKNPRQSEIVAFFSLLALFTGIIGSGCEPEELSRQAGGKCEAGSAQIAIWDGFLQRVCGCGGTDGEIFTPPTPLTCTFKLGQTVVVNYQGPVLTHQIIPVGSPGIPEGPLYDPNSSNRIYSHAFTLTATGNYLFKDQFNSNLTGSFIVTP
ncbi:MAG: hypothetical protein H7301_09600 [Cryobacterium sp.]|nr:hypothetical protein [Oligoflexia bacterium]